MALSQSVVSELLDAFRAGEGVDLIRDAVRLVLQELIEVEATEHIGADRYERSDTRVTDRNGSRPRLLTTQAGDVELRIPKLRKGSFFPSILEPRRRIDQALYAVVMEAYVNGVSTRSVDNLVGALGADAGIKKSEVSRICAGLDEVVGAFRTRRLDHALYRLLRNRLGLDLSRPELVRVQEATAGNPFFALEIGRELIRRQTRLEPGRPLPVPTSLQPLLAMRLSRLSPVTREVLLLTACAGRPTIDLLAAAHGDRAETIEALREAEAEGVVEVIGGRVQFAHALFASALYAQLPARRRSDVHRALAWTVDDIEERAGHLARAAEGPDSVVAGELDAAAEHAAARGAPAVGGELCELAALLTPADPSVSRRRRLRAAAFLDTCPEQLRRLGHDVVGSAT